MILNFLLLGCEVTAAGDVQYWNRLITQRLIVPSKVHTELDIGPDELIQLVPSFQSICLIMYEKDSSL